MTNSFLSVGRIPQFVTFYSFKGGTGRSMALANVAWILAATGRRVLTIDWDLEAPGLHRYFRPFLRDPDLSESKGLIDLLWEYSDLVLKPRKDWPTGVEDAVVFADPYRYIIPLDWPLPDIDGCVHLLCAGRQDAGYGSQVRDFDWRAFYERLGGDGFIESLRTRLDYDYVLIDSRTGVADTSGICTMQLPDQVVLCFTYNRQNIKGAEAVAEAITTRARRAIALVPVAMRVEKSVRTVDQARSFVRACLDRFFPADWSDDDRQSYWASCEIAHYPDYAFEESLALFREVGPQRAGLLADMTWIASRVIGAEISPFPRIPSQVRDRYLRAVAFRDTALQLTLQRRTRMGHPPRNLRELLTTEIAATDFIGRDVELRALQSWLLTAPANCYVKAHCITGPPGIGKTRLAIELCAWAEQQGWTAGFVRQAELERFYSHNTSFTWHRDRPMLVVVDYAAASVRVLRSWLGELARGRPESEEPPLRVLLLERHAARDAGWWAELCQPGSTSGPGPDALIEDAAPLALGPLHAADHRRALLTQSIQLAAPLLGRPVVPLPPPGVDPLFDQRLAGAGLVTEPLFLLMAGILAAETGAPTALTTSRLDLAVWLAGKERDRLQRRARAIGADDSLVPYLAACVTLQAGCDAVAATALVDEERAALGDRSASRTDQLVALLRDALAPAEGDGIDAVRPDLIGEAFLLAELARERRPLPQQAAIVARGFARAGRPVVATVIRTAQDYAQGEATHPSVAWLDQLARLTDNPFALMAIVDESAAPDAGAA